MLSSIQTAVHVLLPTPVYNESMLINYMYLYMTYTQALCILLIYLFKLGRTHLCIHQIYNYTPLH